MDRSVLFIGKTTPMILIDVPGSIQEAQNCPWQVASSPPLIDPYPSLEPKGRKRETYLRQVNTDDLKYHRSLQDIASVALAEMQDTLVKEGHSLHHPRHYAKESGCHSDEPLLAAARTDDWLTANEHDIQQPPIPPLILSTSESVTCFQRVGDIQNNVVVNTSTRSCIVKILDCGSFFIPADTHFILSSIENGASVIDRYLESITATDRHFHLILMDPPWNNRSVHRAGTYRTARRQETDPFSQTLPIIHNHLASEGLLAIWVTNSYKVRRHVLQTMNAAGLNVREEWIWLKITANGQPICQLDGIRRRPYEVLMIFHRQPVSAEIQRRTIIAVPDLHSRKPALKHLFQPLLPPSYHALEIFARSLTAGWWSWGDEVLKFQHIMEGHFMKGAVNTAV